MLWRIGLWASTLLASAPLGIATTLYHRDPSWLPVCHPAEFTPSLRLFVAPGMALKAELCAGHLRSGGKPACIPRHIARRARRANSVQHRARCPACDRSCVMPVHCAGHGQECVFGCRSAPGGCSEAQGANGEALSWGSAPAMLACCQSYTGMLVQHADIKMLSDIRVLKRIRYPQSMVHAG